MPITYLAVVCLPAGIPTDELAATADACLSATPWTGLGPAGHFAVGTRLHRRRLVQPWQGITAGGPVRLLDLDAMRVAAYRAYWYRWQVWSQVVAGTKPAQPYWMFLDRHHASPARYPLAAARTQYLAQPRIAAMQTFNALPNRAVDLPTSHLEALQTGLHSYANLGWLAAVPGEALVCLDGTYLAVDDDRHASHITYLAEANARIAALATTDHLVAVGAR